MCQYDYNKASWIGFAHSILIFGKWERVWKKKIIKKHRNFLGHLNCNSAIWWSQCFLWKFAKVRTLKLHFYRPILQNGVGSIASMYFLWTHRTDFKAQLQNKCHIAFGVYQFQANKVLSELIFNISSTKFESLTGTLFLQFSRLHNQDFWHFHCKIGKFV